MSKTRERAGPVDLRKPAFTAGEVALLCAVAPRTVQKWCNAGTLRCYRAPTRARHHRRRIPAADLLAFMREQGIPVPPELESPPPPVVLATPDAGLADALRPLLGPVPLAHCWGLFELGCAACGRPPLAVIDLALGRADCLRAAPAFAAVVLLAYEDDSEQELRDWTPHVLHRAAPAGEIAGCVRGVLGEGAK